MPKHKKPSTSSAASASTADSDASTPSTARTTVVLAVRPEEENYVMYSTSACSPDTQLLTFPQKAGIIPQILIDICRIYVSASRMPHKLFNISEIAPTIQMLPRILDEMEQNTPQYAQILRFAAAAFTAAGISISDSNPIEATTLYQYSIKHLLSAIKIDASYANSIEFANIFIKTLESMKPVATSIELFCWNACHIICTTLNSAAVQAKHHDNTDFIQAIIQVNRKLALLHAYKENHDQAIEYYSVALSLIEQGGLDEANIEHEIGMSYCAKKDYTEALRHFEKEIKIIIPGVKLPLKLTYAVLAQHHFDNALYAHAINLAEKAVETECSISYDKSSMLNIIASSYIVLGHMTKAYIYIKQAICLHEQEGLLIEELLTKSMTWNEVIPLDDMRGIMHDPFDLIKKLSMLEKCLSTLRTILPNSYVPDAANPLRIKVEDIHKMFKQCVKHLSREFTLFPTELTITESHDKSTKKNRKQEEKLAKHTEVIEFLEKYHHFTITEHNGFVDFDTYLYGTIPKEQRGDILAKLISISDIISIYLDRGDIEHAKQYYIKSQELQRDLAVYIESQIEAYNVLTLIPERDEAAQDTKELQYYTNLAALAKEKQQVLRKQKAIIITSLLNKAIQQEDIELAAHAGTQHFQEKRYQEALQSYKTILSNKHITPLETAQIYVSIGKIYIAQYNHHTPSRKDICELISIIQAYISYTQEHLPGYNYLLPTLHKQLGEAYNIQKYAITQYMQELSKLDFDSTATKTNAMKACKDKAQAAGNEISYLSRALKSFKTITKAIISIDEFNGQRILGQALYGIGQVKEALGLLSEICTMNKQMDSDSKLLESIDYNNVAALYYNMNDMNNAKEYYIKEIPLLLEFINARRSAALEQSQAKELLIHAYQNIATICTNLKQYPEAIECYNSKLLLLDSADTTHSVEIANIYNSMGRVYYLQDKYQDCINAFEKCLPAIDVSIQPTQFRGGIFLSFVYFSRSYMKIDNTDRANALKYANESSKYTNNISLFLGHSFWIKAEAETDIFLKEVMYGVALGHYTKAFTNFTNVPEEMRQEFIVMARAQILLVCEDLIRHNANIHKYENIHKYAQQALSTHPNEQPNSNELLKNKYNLVKCYLTNASSPEAAAALHTYSEQESLIINVYNIIMQVLRCNIVSEQIKSDLSNLYAEYNTELGLNDDTVPSAEAIVGPEHLQHDSAGAEIEVPVGGAHYLEIEI